MCILYVVEVLISYYILVWRLNDHNGANESTAMRVSFIYAVEKIGYKMKETLRANHQLTLESSRAQHERFKHCVSLRPYWSGTGKDLLLGCS